jgi:hypothetical protein
MLSYSIVATNRPICTEWHNSKPDLGLGAVSRDSTCQVQSVARLAWLACPRHAQPKIVASHEGHLTGYEWRMIQPLECCRMY